MRIIVKLLPEFAEAIRSDAPLSGPHSELASVLQKLGLKLSALHPGVSDKELGTYFAVTVPDGSCREIQQELLRTNGVDAAYIKPPDVAP